MRTRIYIKDWLNLKPYNRQKRTDSYYLKLCNKVKEAILANNKSFLLLMYIDVEELNILACFLTSYFEDLISNTNIWNSFVKKHQALYGKQLPFYNLNEYYEEEINLQDVYFLIWYFINTVQEDKFVSPYNDFITDLSDKVMEVFDETWEEAPENEFLKSFYQIDEDEDDFYIARNLIDAVLFKTYLFYPDTFLKLNEAEFQLIEENRENELLITFLNDNRDNSLHGFHTRLLSLTGKEWSSEILGEHNSISKEFLKISKKIKGYFLYKGQDNSDIFIEHIASGKPFKLTKKSFDHSANLTTVDKILFMSIVQWKKEWWFSGVYFEHEYDANLILDEKNSLESRRQVDFLDHQTKDTDGILNEQLSAFKNFNKGSQIAFLPSEQIEEFVNAYVEYFNSSLNFSAKEKKRIREKARSDGYFGSKKKQIDYSEISETGLVFFNPKSGLEIALDINNAFSLDNNPYFDIEYSEDDIMMLLLSDQMSTELVHYCIDNCKNDLPFFNEGIGTLYLEDIDFLLRFWKKESYFSRPSITFTGQTKRGSVGNNRG